MGNKILLTGATGFIGRNVARLLALKKTDFTAIVRPNTSARRLSAIPDSCEIVRIDLADADALKNYLEKQSFDTIIHIGALRGGRQFPEKVYYNANVKATEQIADVSMKNGSKLIFCSSVGVYGAIPQELPANIRTVCQSDNCYHDTKIKAEAIIQRFQMSGLKSIIVRPSIVYGEEDHGFPYMLVKLVHRKLLFLPDVIVRIHLANIDIVADAFYKLAEQEYKEPRIYNIADRYPVKLNELVDFISQRLGKDIYPQNRYISWKYFKKISAFAEKFGFGNLQNRIKLISNSWFYDSSDAFNDLFLRHSKTIPDFKTTVDWYKRKHDIE